MKGPQFLIYIVPILEILKENGGAGSTSEIIDKVIEKLNISEEELAITNTRGQSTVRNRIQWARFYLSKAVFLNTEKRGVWELTQEGFEHKLVSHDQVYSLFREIHKQYEGVKSIKSKKEKNEDDNEIERENDAELHPEKLLTILKVLTASGFEKICKRLLTEIGLHDLVITGRSGDQGVDGVGVIKLNDVVNFNIVFQCKRYKEVVAPHHVRDFRGAMQGRADKGLILTTGRFTAEAKKEANRDGVPPIELIDGERLVELFVKFRLGVRPVIVYEIMPEFFKNFE